MCFKRLCVLGDDTVNQKNWYFVKRLGAEAACWAHNPKVVAIFFMASIFFDIDVAKGVDVDIDVAKNVDVDVDVAKDVDVDIDVAKNVDVDVDVAKNVNIDVAKNVNIDVAKNVDIDVAKNVDVAVDVDIDVKIDVDVKSEWPKKMDIDVNLYGFAHAEDNVQEKITQTKMLLGSLQKLSKYQDQTLFGAVARVCAPIVKVLGSRAIHQQPRINASSEALAVLLL